MYSLNLSHILLESKNLFTRVASAKRDTDFNTTVLNYNNSVRDFVSSYDEKRLYLAKRHGISFGRTTSQGAESGNSMLTPYRKLLMASGILLFHNQDISRILRNKKSADEHAQALPPKISKDLENKRDKIREYKRHAIKISPF